MFIKILMLAARFMLTFEIKAYHVKKKAPEKRKRQQLLYQVLFENQALVVSDCLHVYCVCQVTFLPNCVKKKRNNKIKKICLF